MPEVELCRADWLRENLVLGRGPFDADALRRVSMARVLHRAAYDLLARAEGGPKTVAKALGRVDPDIRGLLALTALVQGWYKHYEPRRLFRHVFCGGWGNLAPEMVEALSQAGAAKQTEALRAALDAFPERMRRDAFRRSELLGDYWAPPNALATAMVEFGEAFGSREELIAIVADLTAGSPKLIAFCEAERAKLDEEERLGWLIETLIQRFDARGPDASERLAAIPDPYRALYLAAYAEFEIYNGGVPQYFTNSSGQFAPMAVDALEAIGLPRQAEIVAKGVALFPEPFPADPGAYVAFRPDGPKRDEPDAEDARWSRELEKKLQRLTRGWGKWETVRKAIVAYAKREGAVPA